MKFLTLFFSLLRWDVLHELRRKETLANMILFAVLVLFVAQMGIGQDPARASSVGPVIFWISILFAGTVGLSQTFAAEREGNTIGGIVTAPIDVGVFYLAKVAATWFYVMIMEILALAVYSILFNFSPWARLGMLLLTISVFTLAYIGSGVILAAMTTTLRGGGEVLLRILLFPIMIPLIWLTLRVSQTIFDTTIAGGELGDPMKFRDYIAVSLAFDAVYLTSGYMLFPKVLEE
jgi:heme exporter protein B